MKRARLRRPRRSDDAQLMMLAGIILTLAFILTALTLSQVAALERQAAAEGPSPIVAEWRFLHERIQTNLRIGVGPETSLQSFKDVVFPGLVATFRSLSAEKGYDLVVRLASDGNYVVTGNEDALLALPAKTHYAATTYDGQVTYTHAKDSDLDGILWQQPCPNAAGPLAGCIGGVYVFMRIADGEISIEESVLFHTNH